MYMDCQAVFAGLDAELPFQYELSLTDREIFADYDPVGAAKVTGGVCNEAGIVSCRLHVTFTLQLQCDRCAEPFTRDFAFDGESLLVTSLNQEDPDEEYVVVPDARLDVDELVESCILLSMPLKVLCKPDCKGLCPTCGQNLNVQTCSCGKQNVDPRWEALRQLLE